MAIDSPFKVLSRDGEDTIFLKLIAVRLSNFTSTNEQIKKINISKIILKKK